jgi:hypothetical protein
MSAGKTQLACKSSEMNPFNTIFPVFKCVFENRQWRPIQEYGTASYIGNEVFITAAHSLVAPQDGGTIRVGLPVLQTSEFTTATRFVGVSEAESHEEWDVGLMRINQDITKYYPMVAALNWYLGPAPYSNVLTDVFAAGFAHGLNTMEDFNAHTSRVYKGTSSPLCLMFGRTARHRSLAMNSRFRFQ